MMLIAPPHRSILRLLPVHRAFNSALPISIKLFSLIRAHSRLKGAINGPMLSYFLLAAPKASRQASKVGSSQGGRLSNLWPLHRHAENISLGLHEQVIDYCSTIDAQSRHMNAAISSHRLLYIAGLIAHRFKSGSRKISRHLTSRDTNEGAASIGNPAGGGQGDKGRYEVEAAIIRDPTLQRLNFI